MKRSDVPFGGCRRIVWVAAASLLSLVPALASAAVLRGRVLDARTREPLVAARITLQGALLGAFTDDQGRFVVADVPPGPYNVQAQQLGYRRQIIYEIVVTPARPTELEFMLEEEVVSTDSVSVTASPFARRAASPVSLRTIGAAEIARFPGGGRDLSKTLQSTPGVASTPNFRNDLIIRGGAPNENRFYLDGVEVPNINHFATQGSSGGPVGMIDVNFIREVDVYTSAFPASRGNALSAVMDFRMRDGNAERRVTTATVGASDLGVTLDGPLGKNTTYILSARRSYLQFLFEALGLPFLPTYNDAQFKLRTKLGDRDEIALLGLGAIDRFTLNREANDTEFKRYLLDNLPVTPQWNYTVGGVWRHLSPLGVTTTVLSRNQLDNNASKYQGNDDTDPAKLLLDYDSRESETKLRVERSERRGAYRLEYGAGLEAAEYTTRTFQKTPTQSGIIVVNYDSKLTLAKGTVFAQVSRMLAGERLTLSLGTRLDGSDYSSRTMRLGQQWSPRFAASYALSPRWRLNFSLGRYLQLPAYTVLGFRDSTGVLANRARGATYIRADHLVGGIELATATNSRITAEGFLKRYEDYPFLLRDQISLANLGADFGVIGNAPSAPTSRGRAYGLELMAQQRLYRGYYFLLAYTLVRSEFATRDGSYQPSAWDNRHLVSLTGGKQFTRGYELGLRWRYLGGAPYTPDDVELSSRQSVWDATGRGVPDYDLLNSRRNGPLHQLDVRFDKTWFRTGSSINLYIDIQNVYAFQPRLAPILLVDRDANGNPVPDPGILGSYLTHTTREDTGALLPTIGVTFEF
ncbi:MAG: TonB-dependent receptor [Candidatus Eisenbacteria bacterium]|uniref:TonB-dependent receptor n=1 Tax=Eiseniibacteriota bacterium TaxID=2212470 RepID=A0A849SDX3_UNCEI|nr:TonB-dependent receptor [Candidatus Eisenbacteria bacterium]